MTTVENYYCKTRFPIMMSVKDCLLLFVYWLSTVYIAINGKTGYYNSLGTYQQQPSCLRRSGRDITAALVTTNNSRGIYQFHGQYLVVLGHYWVVLGKYWVVLVSTWWYWVIIGFYWSVLGGTGSIFGGTGSILVGIGQYLMVLGHYWMVLGQY